ncbi:hypothetical protein CF319_g81 [Tilletia indica]|nr:hypothetical protein CF319_g81 [Tilletia indica]
MPSQQQQQDASGARGSASAYSSMNNSNGGDGVGDDDVSDELPPFLSGAQPFLDTTPLRDLSRRTFFHALAAATPNSSPSSSSPAPSSSGAAAGGGGAATPKPPSEITPKTVILDPALAGPLGLTIDVASLKAHGVDKMFWLELDDNPTEHDQDDGGGTAPSDPSSSASSSAQQQQQQPAAVMGIRARWPPKRLRVPVNAPTRSVVYICRPEIACMRVIAGHIIADLAANSQVPINPSGPLPPSSSLSHTYSLLLSPRRTELSLLYLSSLRLLPAPTPVDSSSASGSSTTTTPTTPSSYLTTVLDLPLEFLPLDGSPASGPNPPSTTGPANNTSTIPPAITSSSLLSLEWTHHFAFTRLYRDGDHASIYLAAQALMTVQHVYGLIPRILGKGDLAKRLADLLIRQRREHLSADPTNPALVAPPTFMPMAAPPPTSSQTGTAGSARAAGSNPTTGATGSAGWSNPNRIDALIIIDRSVDWASVLCTQLTYEGLIKEVVGIRNAHVDVDASLVGGGSNPGPAGTPGSSSSAAVLESRSPGGPRKPNSTPTPSGSKRKYLLSANTDPLYTRLRDLNFSAVGERLHMMATRLNASYADRHSAKTMAEIKAFVGRLGSLQSMHQALGVHTDLTERITRRTSGDEVFHRLLEIQQNVVAGLDTAGQLGAIEDLIYASTSGPGGLLSGTSTRDGQPIAGLAPGSTASLLPILRLLCLMSVVNGGLKAKNLEYVKRELCQTFGYEVLPLLLQLAKVGLLTREGAGPSNVLERSSGGIEGSGPGSAPSMAAGGSTQGSGLPSSLSASGATSYSGFSAVRRALKLINDDVDERNPRDISYVFSGYAPLSVRLVQIVAQREALVGLDSVGGAGRGGDGSKNGFAPGQGGGVGSGAGAGAGAGVFNGGRAGRVKPRAHPIAGWKGYEDVLSILPGATFDEVQRPVQNFRPASSKNPSNAPSSTTTTTPLQPQMIDPDSPRTTLVFFLGGATYAEVSALRFMSAQTRNRRFIAMTTHMVGGDEVLGGLVDGFGR